nr:MAG TPA: Protein of unknown function (DUF3172) [Caudoviricetes sp.]
MGGRTCEKDIYYPGCILRRQDVSVSEQLPVRDRTEPESGRTV